MGDASGIYWIFSFIFLLNMEGSLGQAALVINEFLPDPNGSDGGQEYVELLNTGTSPVSLAAVKLEFANGATGAEWLTRWSGSSVILESGQRYLIVDRNWLGSAIPDAEVYLGLQNGPDAIRLTDNGQVLDLVGYGPLTDAALFETKAVPLKTGRSLARRPDGKDTDNNWADFVSAELTPGEANFALFSFDLLEVSWDPPQIPRLGESLRLNLVLQNNGVELLPGQPCRVVWTGGEVTSWCDQTAPDDLRSLSFFLKPEQRGAIAFAWEYVVPASGDTLRFQLGRVQVGAGSLRLNEVLPVPGQGQGEWIEIQWWGSQSLNLADYLLRDEDGPWRALPETQIGSGEFVVVAEDSAAFVQWQQINAAAGAVICGGELATAQVIPLSGWPSLNNTPPESRLHADRVYLADPSGLVLDIVAWGGSQHELPARDVSLVRIAPEALAAHTANWTVSTSQLGSSPGCRNSVTLLLGESPPENDLQVAPLLLDREAGVSTCHFIFLLSPAEVSWQLKIFNLWGDLVRDFGGDDRGPGPRDLIWNGTDESGRSVADAAYVVWLEVRDNEGGIRRRQKVRLVVR